MLHQMRVFGYWLLWAEAFSLPLPTVALQALLLPSGNEILKSLRAQGQYLQWICTEPIAQLRD